MPLLPWLSSRQPDSLKRVRRYSLPLALIFSLTLAAHSPRVSIIKLAGNHHRWPSAVPEKDRLFYNPLGYGFCDGGPVSETIEGGTTLLIIP
jgi:hypothetical protein